MKKLNKSSFKKKQKIILVHSNGIAFDIYTDQDYEKCEWTTLEDFEYQLTGGEIVLTLKKNKFDENFSIR